MASKDFFAPYRTLSFRALVVRPESGTYSQEIRSDMAQGILDGKSDRLHRRAKREQEESATAYLARLFPEDAGLTDMRFARNVMRRAAYLSALNGENLLDILK